MDRVIDVSSVGIDFYCLDVGSVFCVCVLLCLSVLVYVRLCISVCLSVGFWSGAFDGLDTGRSLVSFSAFAVAVLHGSLAACLRGVPVFVDSHSR